MVWGLKHKIMRSLEKKLYWEFRSEKCCSIYLWLGCLRSSVILLDPVRYSQGWSTQKYSRCSDWYVLKTWEMHSHYNMLDLLLIILFSLWGMEGKPSLWELDSNYSLHVGSNGDDSHAYNAWYRKLLSSVDLTKDFV